jgi:hypothetical protein
MSRLDGGAAALRAAFDAAFAEPATTRVVARTRLLRVRTAAHPVALPLAELAGLHRCPPVAPLPGMAPGLLGLATLRDRVVAVWHLAPLLELGAGAAPRWAVQVRAAPGLLLAFEDCDGVALAAGDALGGVPAGLTRCSGSARLGDGPWPIADLRAITTVVQHGAEPPRGETER